ncbi:aminotransferase class V-fold PLP-dependent enzyme [bacterium]|nr:aminotransferase class V-fold PLP-dependent enzyme [bacterium]
MTALPEHGRSAAAVLDDLDRMASEDVDWRSGRAFSLAYHAGPDVEALAELAHARFAGSNLLNVAAFPSLRTMQSDVLAMVGEMLHAGPGAAGSITAGGTESILLAVKAARALARAERGIDRPRLVLPTTAHAAFEKAAADYGVRSVRVDVGPDFRAVPGAIEAAIDADTVLVACSAPSYPQGVVDPVGEIAAIAAARGVPCHVDACMGGLTLPMMERAGEAVRPFDFRVPGVTSISVDLHKYGYAPKGISVLLHRDKRRRAFQAFTTDNWLGGFYGSLGVLGTRGGGPLAAAWAVMNHLGADGYLRLAREAREATLELVGVLRGRPGVRLLAEPDATLLAFAFEDADAFAVGDGLRRRGFWVDQQAPPPSLHCTVNAVHRRVVGEFAQALASAHEEARASGARSEATAYGRAE